MWDYFLVWNKLLRIYADSTNGRQFSFSWASRSPCQSTPTLSIHNQPLTSSSVFLSCLPSYTSLRTALKHRSQPISVPQRVLWSSLKWRTECKKQGLWNWSRRVEETSWALRELLNASKKHHHKFLITKFLKMTKCSVMSQENIWAYIFALMWPGLDRFTWAIHANNPLSVSALVLLPTIVPTLVLWLVNLTQRLQENVDAYNLMR